MSTTRFPEGANLRQLRHQAKELFRDCQAGDTTAQQRMAVITQSSGKAGSRLTLALAQQVLAHEFGFENWPQLQQQVEQTATTMEAACMERLKEIGGQCKLDDLGRLQGVSLQGKQFVDTDVEHLAGLTRLRELYFTKTRVTDAGLEPLRSLTGCSGCR